MQYTIQMCRQVGLAASLMAFWEGRAHPSQGHPCGLYSGVLLREVAIRFQFASAAMDAAGSGAQSAHGSKYICGIPI